MPINTGYILNETTDRNGTTVGIRIYYDATSLPIGPSQPLINGPRGYCLDISNPSGRKATVTISRPGVPDLTVSVGTGDPVTSGAGRSRTAAEVAAAGYTTRGDITDLTFG